MENGPTNPTEVYKVRLPRGLDYWYLRGKGALGLSTKRWLRGTITQFEQMDLDALIQRWYQATMSRPKRQSVTELDLTHQEVVVLLKCAAQIDRYYQAKNAHGRTNYPTPRSFGKLGEETRTRAMINQALINYLQHLTVNQATNPSPNPSIAPTPQDTNAALPGEVKNPEAKIYPLNDATKTHS